MFDDYIVEFYKKINNLNHLLDEVIKELNQYPTGPMGLTPDGAKDARYHKLRHTSTRLFKRIQSLNTSPEGKKVQKYLKNLPFIQAHKIRKELRNI